MLDSVVKVGKKYYPQVFLEECKYIKRKNKMFNYINDDLEMTSPDEDDGIYSESDSESTKSSFFSIIFLIFSHFFPFSF